MPTSSSSNARARVDRFDTARTPHSQSGGALRLDERIAVLRDRLEARADSRAAEQLRADVREARSHVKDWSPERAVSETTSRRYGRVVEKMSERGERLEDSACRSTFEFRRAALIYQTRADLKTALTELDRAKRAGDLQAAAGALNRLRSGLETLRKYPPSTGDRERDLARASAFHGPSRPPEERSNGKRASLSNLPSGWRDDVQYAARSQDRAPMAALSLTGCRPAEVKGIKVRQADERVTLEIRGAKYDGDRGVKTRSISFEKSELERSQAGRDLQAWLGSRECRTIAHQGSVEAFRERVARAADRAGHDDVSAYTFRHAAARELKNSGADREEIAQRLGHRSERSQTVYG